MKKYLGIYGLILLLSVGVSYGQVDTKPSTVPANSGRVTAKSSPVAADSIPVWDSAASNNIKKSTLQQISDSFLAGIYAPKSAKYLTAQDESGLSGEVNLGLLTSGLLKHTVAAGVSTPATAVSGTDYYPPISTGTVTSSATPTPAVGTVGADVYYDVTALAEAATFGAPTGTPTNGQRLTIRIIDNGTARALAWNAIYANGPGFALPNTTVVGETQINEFLYSTSLTKWVLEYRSGGKSIYQDAAGNAGVGTASPGAKLHIYKEGSNELRVEANDGSNDRSAKLSLQGSGNGGAITGGAIIDFTDSDGTPGTPGALTFQKSSSTYMTILNGGNVGIGTTSPGGNLEVVAAGGNGTDARFTSYDSGSNHSVLSLRKSDSSAVGTLLETDDGDILGSFRAYGVGTGLSWQGAAQIDILQDGAAGTRIPGAILFKVATDSATPAEMMRITKSGNVGIGTAAPIFKEDINGGTYSRLRHNKLLFNNAVVGTQLALIAETATNGLFTLGGTGYLAANATIQAQGVQIVSSGLDDDSINVLVNNPVLNLSQNPVVSFRFKLDSVTNGCVFVGLTTGAFVNKTTLPNDCALIGIDADNGHGFGAARLVLVTRNNGAAAVVDDLGVNMANNTGVWAVLDTADPNQPRVWINGTEVSAASILGTIKDATNFYLYAHNQNLAAGAHTMTWVCDQWQNDQPY